MKYRSDFVTNSSSSSFIIGEYQSGETVESVYQKIRGFYLEFYKLVTEVKKSLSENSPIHIVEENGHYTFRVKNKNLSYDKQCDIFRDYEKKFKIDIQFLYVYFDRDKEWLNCETYQEYENFWIKKIKEDSSDKSFVHAPFSIHKIGEPYYILENGHYGIEYICNDEEHLLCWYFETSSEEEFLEEHSKPVQCYLGEVAITSESGYIYEYVVKKLADISKMWCNHMG